MSMDNHPGAPRKAFPGVDYRALLKKYMAHVGRCEGTTFIAGVRPEGLTDDEWEALRELDEETETS